MFVPHFYESSLTTPGASQTETHDSIEDACTALALYQRYVQLRAEGEFEDTLQGLYALGHATNWKA